ncbi:MAG: nucleotidyltransferase family protein [Acidobacteria bacterium]|nr:MAG: nucleotidyltransferase family protein [Acidobacteriota bacterium]
MEGVGDDPQRDRTDSGIGRDLASTVGAVVLAAGLSSRFEAGPKQLAVHRGETLVRRTARTLLASRCHPVVVVLGHRAEAVRRELDDLDPLVLATNPRPERGLASSVAVGLAALREREPTVSAALFVPIDLPGLDASLVDRLVQAHVDEPDRVVQPRHDGRPASPTLFPARLFEALAGLHGDEGGRQLIRSGEPVRWVEVEDRHQVVDVDTVEDLAALSSAGDRR